MLLTVFKLRSFHVTLFHVALFFMVLVGLHSFSTRSLGMDEALGLGPDEYFKIDINNIGYENLELIKSDADIRWWIEADGILLVLAPTRTAGRLNRVFDVDRLNISVHEDRLYLMQNFHQKELERLSIDVLVTAGRMALVQTKEDGPPRFMGGTSLYVRPQQRILQFQPNMVFARQAVNDLPGSPVEFSSEISDVVNAVDGNRWFTDVKMLTTMNRDAYGEGILKVRDWLEGQFSKILGGLGVQVRHAEFPLGEAKGFNVIARVDGSIRPDEIYIVGAHYDATSEDVAAGTPGAEDNASGTAGLLEMARAISKHRPKATLIFVAFSAEEAGLEGSYAYVKQLISSGERDKVKGVIVMDMIGYSATDNLACLLETSKSNTPIVNILSAAAKEYAKCRVVTTFNYFGSDHVPFIDNKFPALLTIDNDWSRYPNYHTTRDTPEYLKIPMAREMLRMNTATIAQWILN